MKIRIALCGLVAAIALGIAPNGAAAQGSLSVQGLGYPPGQFGTRALGTGGAMGEVDPTSTVNPAAILEFGAAAMAMQIAPEFRKVTDGSSSSTSSTQRFPLFIGALPIGDNLMFGVSSSTLLDRTWQTTTPQSQYSGGDTVLFNSTAKSDGSVNDFAFTAAYAVKSWFRVGVALHAINGRDVLTTTRTFQDTVRYGNSLEDVTSTYTGNAISAGMEMADPSVGGIALSYRRGGRFEQTLGDTLVSKARVPDRFGASAIFSGFSGTVLAIRTAYDEWSAFGAMDSASGAARNSWDSSIGGEFSGARFGSLPLVFRAGARWRDLPFPADGQQVHEGSVSGGLGLVMARGHAAFDLSMIRAQRSAGIGISESAWTMSAGITIRP
ncbi:MAG TPA: hypothetical protein VIJ16_11845 [Gemmatimonadaceae bacterium]